MVEDAFKLTCSPNITVEQYSEFSFETTITNIWDVTVHNVSAVIYPSYFLETSDTTVQIIGNLLPNEKRDIRWQLNATSLGELPVDIFVVSDDGGYDTTSSIIISMQQIVMDDGKDTNGSPGFDLMFLIGAIAIVMVLLRRRK